MRAAVNTHGRLAMLRFISPVPPASRNGGATTQAERDGSRASAFRHRNRAGIAHESWISGVSACKSLIVEKTTAMSHREFATSHAAFAMSPIFAPTAVTPFSSLSNSLKKKKKESEEEQGVERNMTPRVNGVLPSVTDTAYFLGHELLSGAMPE
jgi:hypothetical protein